MDGCPLLGESARQRLLILPSTTQAAAASSMGPHQAAVPWGEAHRELRLRSDCQSSLAHVQIDAVANGYDPMLGIMHNGRKGSPGWALDMIEPHRPVVDGAVLSLIREQRFAAADFTMRRDGVCRLAPQLARTVATLVSALGTGSAKAALPGRKPTRRKRAVAD